MNDSTREKVTARHLKREAFLYVRQSTLRQVLENSESTRRQYALRQRAIALGWPEDRIVVIDSDLGQSGASAADREGFQRLVAEVALGRAGIVLGLEVSRLARNSSDWHRLLEMCAMSGTLILDEDGVYDPCQFNDRLLLGLKGAMSEAELHVLQARLQGGMRNKARRGELLIPIPIGFAYDGAGHVVLDPDAQVRQCVRLFFETYRRTGSAWSTVKAFRSQGILFPHRIRRGPNKGGLEWLSLEVAQALHILHNPRYTGAFVYGKSRQRKRAGGGVLYERVPEEEWLVCIRDAHEGYLTWDEYQENERRLRESSQSHGEDRRRSPAREGPALLQGIAMCGRCGLRMTVRYHARGGCRIPEYRCVREQVDATAPACQVMTGARIDAAVGDLLLEKMTPVAIEAAFAVQEELRARADEAGRLRRQAVERARYEAEVAQRRFLQVDPDHRLVADALEADWNAKLRTLEEVRQECERHRESDLLLLDEAQRARVAALATDFPRVWRDTRTPDRERKRMVRLLIEDATILKEDAIVVHIRFKGGAVTTLRLPLPPTIGEVRKTSSEVVEEVDRLLDEYGESEIAAIFNEGNVLTATGERFTAVSVGRIRRSYGLASRYDRLRERGLMTVQEVAAALGITAQTAQRWAQQGVLKSHCYSEKNERLYERPGPNAPKKHEKLRTKRVKLCQVNIDPTDEV